MKKRYKGPTPQNKTPRPNRRYHSMMYNSKGYNILYTPITQDK